MSTTDDVPYGGDGFSKQLSNPKIEDVLAWVIGINP
jgi:hypothetical protein